MQVSLIVCLFCLAAGTAAVAQAMPQSANECVPVARWRLPGDNPAPLNTSDVLARIKNDHVVLLGETHDSAEHHRWQLAMMAALHARNPNLVLGFEMFPRRVQPVLNRWVAGELSETEFLGQVEWDRGWRLDPALYMPLFHFARMQRLPMVALNVEMSLIRDVGLKGFESIDEVQREGVTRPAPPRAVYLAKLRPVFEQHKEDGISGKNGGEADVQFRRFVESQQIWDRAMAQGIARVLVNDPGATVVGIMGWDHVAHGYGVPHQLRNLNVHRVASLLPWDEERDCEELKLVGIADAVFGVAADPETLATDDRPRLGVRLDSAEGGVRISEVLQGSLAEASGLRMNDVITETAGAATKQPADVIDAVQRQAPGTWLPIKVRRDEQTAEIVVKFLPLVR
jgi:uncharacterized iron-regulated protein